MSGNRGAGLTEELLTGAGVTMHPHWLGGLEFQLNGNESIFKATACLTCSSRKRNVIDGLKKGTQGRIVCIPIGLGIRLLFKYRARSRSCH